jgi:hypothetical protein
MKRSQIRLVSYRSWLLLALTLVVSAATLACLDSAQAIPSLVRTPLSYFVQPGVTVWWLVLGGPFRTVPYSATGIAFAAAANALFWLLALWFVVWVCSGILRKLAAPRS